MNTSGSLFGDLALVCFILYVFNGGWLATVAGWVFCFAGWRHRRRSLTLALAAACLAPISYIAVLALLSTKGPSFTSSDWGAILGVAGLAISALAAPVAAFVTFRRGVMATTDQH
jgi:hypothetical protein